MLPVMNFVSFQQGVCSNVISDADTTISNIQHNLYHQQYYSQQTVFLRYFDTIDLYHVESSFFVGIEK